MPNVNPKKSASSFVPRTSPSDQTCRCDDQLEEDTKPDLNDDETEVEPNLGSKAKRTKRMRTASGGKAVGKAWTGQEDCILFPQLHPKAEVEWNAMAAATGRDAKVSARDISSASDEWLMGAVVPESLHAPVEEAGGRHQGDRPELMKDRSGIFIA